MPTPQILQGPLLLDRFQALDHFLARHQPLWRPRPFHHLQLPWEADHPELATHLRQCTLDHAEAADVDTTLDAPPQPFLSWANEARDLSLTADLPDIGLPAAPHRLDVNVPGRKWQQIEAFTRRLDYRCTPTHWIDWCAGKGHLGRRLLQPGQHLTCLEYDPALVTAGAALSQHHQLPAEHIQQDVMAPHCAQRLTPEASVVALHACGDLHVRLLQLASERGCPQIAIAPCCYNRISGAHYRALSAPAQASPLHLTLDDLALPLSETVTASARTRRQRDLSMSRRLSFDLLQREQRGCDDYLPTPSLPVDWLHKPFDQYCQDLAALKALPLQGQPDWPTLEAAGWHRLAEVRNLERVRNLFRRPLELWLVLDRALFLQQQNYRVRVGSFCAHRLTPRNLLLLAER
ncbi:methyltransferase [Pseudomonas sp. RP23018S]|uniref:methyltransferase n=1 Tax=Pseudomonas sp. RP23018S TaxID=3096037 RepID=UPI002ACABADC|nr:methyltransferase [Pseudomonas sp. RP23018S]MDZ5604029.1 methyltransferase [Pseudomonas sp. RP23018S]